MTYRYGKYNDKQMDKFLKKLHNKIHWMIIYKDPKNINEHPEVDFDKFYISLMHTIDGLNQLLFYPPEIIEIDCILQEAYSLTKKKDFDYQSYRKLILDAHNLVDKINKR